MMDAVVSFTGFGRTRIFLTDSTLAINQFIDMAGTNNDEACLEVLKTLPCLSNHAASMQK